MKNSKTKKARKIKKFKWEPFEKLLAKSGSRSRQVLGVGSRAFFVEVVTPSSGSFYLKIPGDYALMSPRPIKEIYKVGEAYSSYYMDLQDQLKSAPIPVVSIDGDFLVTSTEVFTFNKHLTPLKVKTTEQTLEEIKVSSGIDISDEDDSEESSSKEEPEPVVTDLVEEVQPSETIIEFDSEDEMEDFFQKKEKKKKKKVEDDTSEKKSSPQESTKPEVLQIGVVFPLLTINDIWRKNRDGTLQSWAASAKNKVAEFESGNIKGMIAQIDSKINALRDRMAAKIAQNDREEKRIQKEIQNKEKSRREARQILDKQMALQPKEVERVEAQAKKELASLHIALAQEREDIKFTLKYFLSALDEIE